MHFFKFCLLVASLIVSVRHAGGTVNVLGEIIQYNIVGLPVIHQKHTWVFDPDAGLRRAGQYQQVNGFRGEKLVERLGLGVDGKEEQRLQQQRQRDEGHLGGLNFYRP